MPRIIAGTAKGMRLQTPEGKDVRPTLDRVREACFSMLGPRLPGARFLDLFAGSGANGLEALSRGAASCVFVDDRAASIAAIRANLTAAGFAKAGVIVRGALPGALTGLRCEFDIIYADPPFDYSEYEILLEAIRQHTLLADGGVFVLEHAAKRSAELAGLVWAPARTGKYGRNQLSIFY